MFLSGLTAAIFGLVYYQTAATVPEGLAAASWPPEQTWIKLYGALLVLLGVGNWWFLRLRESQRRAQEGLDRQNLLLQQEIAERRRAEIQYRGLVESARAIVWRGDPGTFQLTYVSPEAETLLGYPLAAWTTEPDFWQRHVHPDDREWAVAFCAKETAALRPHTFEYRMIAADGRVVWLYDVVELVIEEGQPKELVGVMMAITERKRAETLLATEKRVLEMIAG